MVKGYGYDWRELGQINVTDQVYCCLSNEKKYKENVHQFIVFCRNLANSLLKFVCKFKELPILYNVLNVTFKKPNLKSL